MFKVFVGILNIKKTLSSKKNSLKSHIAMKGTLSLLNPETLSFGYIHSPLAIN